MNEVIIPNSTIRSTGRKNYRVLVVDRLSTKLISSCCKMHDIYDHGITLVEDLLKLREPIVELEAVYLINPIKESVDALINDFASELKPMYKAAYVYFIQRCPDELFNDLRNSIAVKKIKTLKEINASFVPYERQVFLVDFIDMFQCYYDPSTEKTNLSKTEYVAQQIATVCDILGEYPSVRYRNDRFGRANDLAQIVQQKLNACKVDNPKLGKGLEKSRSQLIILDREFDCVSPILHELTYQAMVYDNLKIVNDIYKYVSTEDHTQNEVILDENDELWIKLRHEHIAKVAADMKNNLKTFVDCNRVSVINENKSSGRKLSYIINKMTQQKRKLSKYSTHLNLSQNCLNCYTGYVDLLCNVEQDLVMGTDFEGNKINDYLKNILDILLDPKVRNLDKMKIIILYILSKNGISEDNLNKLILHAQLSLSDKQTIVNLNLLGVNIIMEDVKRKKPCKTPQKDRITDTMYHLSRWTPLIKDIIEDSIEDKLDSKHFPFVTPRIIIEKRQVPISVRFRNWHTDKINYFDKNVSRIIIFIIGGMTFSEMRAAYEVTKNSKSWEVIIGSSCILTPDDFLNKLSCLN